MNSGPPTLARQNGDMRLSFAWDRLYCFPSILLNSRVPRRDVIYGGSMFPTCVNTSLGRRSLMQGHGPFFREAFHILAEFRAEREGSSRRLVCYVPSPRRGRVRALTQMGS